MVHCGPNGLDNASPVDQQYILKNRKYLKNHTEDIREFKNSMRWMRKPGAVGAVTSPPLDDDHLRAQHATRSVEVRLT